MKLKIAALGAKGIPHPGGIELVMEEIGSRLVKKGHRFDIFVRKHYMIDKPFNNYKGIGLPRSPGLHNKYFDAMSHSASAIPNIIINNYNVFYINSVGLSTLAWLPRIVGRKVVVHTHGLDWKREKWKGIAKKMVRMSAWSSVNFPNLTFCVCQEDKRFLESFYGRPCHYIPNGIPKVVLRQPHEIEAWGLKRDSYLLFMARLVPEKGAHFLLHAWNNIPEEYKRNKKLVIAGDSNHRDGYYYDIKDFNRFEDIVFTGFATGSLKEELLSNALCFTQPSTIEGMPLSLLEAMGYGRMILSSDIQENMNVLSGHGLTFKSRNIDDLTRKLIQILSLKKDVIELKGRNIERYGKANFNWDQIVDKVERLLSALVYNR